MKILYFTTIDASDDMAPSVHVRGTCRALHEMGHRVALLHAVPPERQEFTPEWAELTHGVPWPQFRGGWRIFQLLAALRLVQIAKRWKPDVIYMRATLTGVLEQALRICGVPTAMEVNGIESLKRPSFSRSLRVCDLVLADTDSMRCDLVDGFPEHAHKFREHLTFVTDPEHFHPMDRMSACAQLGLDPMPLRLFHVSSFYPWHDFETMISAVKILASRLTRPVELRLVGDGLLRPEIEDHVRSEGLEAIVVLPGRVDHAELPKHIAASDIAVDLFITDRLRAGKNLAAYKLYEYMACARPAITAVSSEFYSPEWAREYLALIPPEDPAALADAVQQIVESPAIWQDKAARAREHVKQYHTWRAATETTLVHLNELVGRNG